MSLQKNQNSSTNQYRTGENAKGNWRSNRKIKYLKMLKGGKPVRNEKGDIIVDAPFQSKSIPDARVAPDRRYFGNSRTVTQSDLDRAKSDYKALEKNPMEVLLHQKTLPMSLINAKTHVHSVNKQFSNPFESVFGHKSQREVPDLGGQSMEELALYAKKKQQEFLEKSKKNGGIADSNEESFDNSSAPTNKIFSKGTSKRIWSELYKVVDSSDIIIQVLDARNPLGTRCEHIELYLKNHAYHKSLILLLNKCDLIPSWTVKKWVNYLSKEYPTLAFHASIENSFGKGALISLLRQLAQLFKDRPQISVGFIGYPNVGKSSVINTLMHKKVCPAAPIPGETKVWQYVRLFSRVFLVDCPGVVYKDSDTDSDSVLKGVIRVEKIAHPENYIWAVLQQVKKTVLQKTYGVDSWEDPPDFLRKLAMVSKKFVKGGEPDINAVSRRVLLDYQRGNLPYFIPPPEDANQSDDDDDETGNQTIALEKMLQRAADQASENVKANISNPIKKKRLNNDSSDESSIIAPQVVDDDIENVFNPKFSDSVDEIKPITVELSEKQKKKPLLDPKADDMTQQLSSSRRKVGTQKAAYMKKQLKSDPKRSNKRNVRRGIEITKEARFTGWRGRKVGEHYYDTADVKGRRRAREKHNL